MQSTFVPDPIGPRSVDEMLDVVYDRAAVLHRRRTMQRVGSAAVAVVLAVVGTLTLQGDDEGAHVRVVDDRTGRQEEGAPPGPDGGRDASASPAPRPPNGGGAPKPGKAPGTGTPASGTATTLPAMPTPPTPVIESWEAVTDATGDATPGNWYWDITAAAIDYDDARRVMVFTTRYRSPDQPTGGRQARKLKSQFSYDGEVYSVAVEESGDQLGEVTIDHDVPCPGCTARFEVEAARLVVSVPVDVMNEVIGRKRNSPALGAGAAARVEGLLAMTTTVGAGGGVVDADTAGQGAA